MLALYVGLGAQTAPRYKFDPEWPKPLPNKWKIGGITGLAVDRNDDVWVLNRPNDLTDIELHAELTPPAADCCVRPPSMIHIDKNGNVIGSFDAPQGHGMDVDSKGFVYIGQDTVRKYDPKTGKVVAEVPRVPETEGGGPPGGRGAAPRVPGRGGRGPVAGFLGRGGGSSAEGAARAADAAAFRAKYPAIDADDRRRHRGDSDRRAERRDLRRRQLSRRTRDGVRLQDARVQARVGRLRPAAVGDQRPTTPTVPTRPAGRCRRSSAATSRSTCRTTASSTQPIATRTASTSRRSEGKFLKEFKLAEHTGVGGATGGVGFSPDKQQRFLYISDLTNNHIYFLNREDGKEVGRMGSMGESGGSFWGLHMIAVDSKGNIYTGEVFAGQRMQRFVPADSPRGKLLEQLSKAAPVEWCDRD